MHISASDNSQPAWPPYVTKARIRYPRAWQPWSQEEDELLLTMFSQMRSLEDIAKELGRGCNGVRLRLRHLQSVEAAKTCSSPSEIPQQAARFVPVPQLNFVPSEIDFTHDVRLVEETAQMWGVDALSLSRAVQSLDQTHWLVFTLRYGLAGRCAYSLEAVASLLGKSSAKVERLQGEAEEMVRAGLAYYGANPIRTTLNETLARRYGRAVQPSIPGKRVKRSRR